MPAGPLGEPCPPLGVDERMRAAEAWRVHGVGFDGQRKLRRRRQAGQPGSPVLVGRGYPLRVRRDLEDIVAERHLQCRQRRVQVAIERVPLGEQHHDAASVERDAVEPDPDPESRPAAAVTVVAVVHVGDRADREQRPVRGVSDVVRRGLAQLTERVIGRVSAVGDRDPVAGHFGQHSLRAIRRHDRAKHLVPFDQPVPRLFQPFQVDLGAVELEVEVRRHATQGKLRVAADPVRPLHLGQRERLEPAGRVGSQRGLFGPLSRRQRGGEAGQLRCREQRGQRRAAETGLAQPVDQPGGQQAVSAQREESVPAAHPIHLQQLRPQPGHGLLHRPGRRFEAVGGRVAGLGEHLVDGLTVDLAVGRDR